MFATNNTFLLPFSFDSDNAAPAQQGQEEKRKPHRLIVEDAINDDDSVASLNQARMDELGLFHGDVTLIKGKRKQDTVSAPSTGL